MKTKFLAMLLVVIFFGCTKHEPTIMTAQEQEVAKKEIRAIVDQILQNANKMDAEALLQSYSNSPDFLLLNTDGTMVDFQGAKNGTIEIMKGLSSLKYTTIKDEFRFLPDNLVICAWLGKCEMTLKTGENMKNDIFGVTLVFSKIDNQWKVIYSHESSLPPVQVKTE